MAKQPKPSTTPETSPAPPAPVTTDVLVTPAVAPQEVAETTQPELRRPVVDEPFPGIKRTTY